MTLSADKIGINATLTYEGSGFAEFGNPSIQVNGPTVVKTDQQGNTTAEMRVENVPSSPSLDEGLNRLLHDAFKNMTKRTACALSVVCPNGVFTANQQTFAFPSIDFGKRKASIEFRCNRSQFENPDVATVYWQLPIWNFHGELRPAMAMPKFMHVLRLSDETPLATFEFLGEMGFIEFAPGYKELIEQQKEGDRQPKLTATMVGATAGQATSWDALDSWFPFEYLAVLGIASGSRVGAPWIEFFDAQGNLAKRIHVHLGTNRYETGHSFINDIIHRGGLGRLLTCAGKSPEFNKTYMRIAMNHLLLGLRHSQSLQDRISHLSRALDALAGEFGLRTQYLLEHADDAAKGPVKEVLRLASLQIEGLAREQDDLGRTDVASSLRRIAERTISTPANVDRDFGLSVLALLERFDLNDASVVDAYYRVNPRADGRCWHQLLSQYRGLSQHGGEFRFREREHSPIEVYRLSNHLADIIARIILKQLGYDGEYQRATATWRDSHSLDWVTPSTLAEELGYGREE